MILKYKPSTGKFFSEVESRERFLKAYKPEEWVIKKCIAAHFDANGNLDEAHKLDAEELLEEVHELVEEHMLEKTIFIPHSDEITKIIRETINVNPKIEKTEGKWAFVGLSFDAAKIDD